jgi:hypothetical protein
MMYLFIAVAGGVLMGTVLLWLSGYYSGQAIAGKTISDSNLDLYSLQKQLESAQKNCRALQAQLKEARVGAASPPGPPKKSAPQKTTPAPNAARDDKDDDKDAEIARLNSQIVQLEGERDKVLFDLDGVKEELETAKEKLTQSRPMEKPTTLPKPAKRQSIPHSESEALDELQAELDMEKVAHQRVREDLKQVQTARAQVSMEREKIKKELEQVKKLAALQISSDSGGTDASPGGSRFKTMAMGMKSPLVASGDSNKLQATLEKTQSEKERLETELDRTRKELQLLKMRNDTQP